MSVQINKEINHAPFDKGQTVYDAEQEQYDNIAFVVELTGDRADEHYIEGTGCSVYEYNKDYPREDEVVIITFDGEDDYYAYPHSRLS